MNGMTASERKSPAEIAEEEMWSIKWNNQKPQATMRHWCQPKHSRRCTLTRTEHRNRVNGPMHMDVEGRSSVYSQMHYFFFLFLFIWLPLGSKGKSVSSGISIFLFLVCGYWLFFTFPNIDYFKWKVVDLWRDSHCCFGRRTKNALINVTFTHLARTVHIFNNVIINIFHSNR